MVTSQKLAAPPASLNANPNSSAARTTPSVAEADATPSLKQPSATAPQPSEDEIRDYAKHLYVQRGSLNGHDYDDWLEAEACFGANFPKGSSRTRMHHHTQITDRAAIPCDEMTDVIAQ